MLALKFRFYRILERIFLMLRLNRAKILLNKVNSKVYSFIYKIQWLEKSL
jgi:hypothetical protein